MDYNFSLKEIKNLIDCSKKQLLEKDEPPEEDGNKLKNMFGDVEVDENTISRFCSVLYENLINEIAERAEKEKLEKAEKEKLEKAEKEKLEKAEKEKLERAEKEELEKAEKEEVNVDV